jgi:hypothetical protein
MAGAGSADRPGHHPSDGPRNGYFAAARSSRRGIPSAFSSVTVMPGSTRNILGLSALRRVAPFTLDLEPARLTLSGCDQG